MYHRDDQISKNKGRKHILIWVMFILMLAAIGFKLYLVYLPMSVFHYLVPPGGDGPIHAGFVQDIVQGNFQFGYPFLFHLFAAAISKVINQSPLQTLRIITPVLTVLPAISIYIFCRRLFGQVTGWIGFFLTLMVSNYALMAYGDGNYPNLIAAGFLLPLVLLYLVKSLEERKLTNYIWMIILTVLLVLTHHLATVYLLLIVLSFLLVVGILRIFEKIAPNYKRVVTAVLIIGGISALLIIVSPFRQMFSLAFTSIRETGSFLAGSQWAQLIDFAHYGPQIGPLTFYGGLFSIFYLIYRASLNKDTETRKLTLILVLVWFGILFLGSRLIQVGLLGRFTRELALPLIIAQAVFLSDMLKKIRGISAKLIALGFLGLVFWINLGQINNGEYRAPEFFNQMVWFDQDDQIKTDKINELVGSDKIILTNETNPNLRFFISSTIVNNALSNIQDESAIKTAVKNHGAAYLFISTGLNGNYTYYVGEKVMQDFGKNKDLIEEFMPAYEVVYEFKDGSKLYCVKCTNKTISPDTKVR